MARSSFAGLKALFQSASRISCLGLNILQCHAELLPDTTISKPDQPVYHKVRRFYRIAEPALKTNHKSIME